MPSLGSLPPGKGAKKRVLRRYLKVKATKPEERGDRESERSIVLMKQGNRPEGTLWREGGAVLLEPLEGKMQGTLGPESVSTGLQRVTTLSREAPEMVWTTLAHRHLRGFLDKRVRDGVIRKTIDKWLTAGVLEEGTIREPRGGTPQGGVISPLLANISLHEVLDKWFEQEVKPRLMGEAFLIRYADDAVIVFYSKTDADRVLAVLPKRFGRFGLALHPDKTRLIRFTRPGGKGNKGDPSHPGIFDFLGFTHYWGKAANNRWVVKRKTARDRFTRALKRVSQWCRQHLRLPIKERHRLLVLKLRGHDQYYGIRGNSCAIARFHHEVRRTWRKWLDRRSQRSKMTWERFTRFSKRYSLPALRIAPSEYARSKTTI